MRLVKLCLVLGVVAAFVMPAAALPLPPVPGGIDFLKSRNQDNGSTYFISDTAAYLSYQGTHGATLLDTVPVPIADLGIAGITQGKPQGAMPISPGGPLEDTWGIFRLYYIAPGQLTTISQVTQVDGSTAWDDSTGNFGTWLVGMFWGGQDVSVKFNGLTTVTITTSQVHFELWAVPKTQVGGGAVGTAGNETLVDYVTGNRTAPNRYPGWLDPVAGNVELLTGVSTEFIFTGTASPSGISGKSGAYFDINQSGPGIWDALWGSNPALKSYANGVPSDVYFDWDISSSGRNWEAKSVDNGGAGLIVPEPLTMLGVFLGVGSLGGYLRRRSK